MKPKKYRITNVRSGHWIKYRGNDSLAAVKSFFSESGFKPNEFETDEILEGTVLKVSRRGEESVLLIVRDSRDDHAPINYQQEAQTAIPGLTC